MIRLLIYPFLACILIACSTNEEPTTFDPDEYPQKWELVKMTGQIANLPPATGERMAWQEYYLLQEDGSFEKVRTRKGNQLKAKGTYHFEVIDDEYQLQLEFSSESPLIGNCSRNTDEMLYLNEDHQLISNWWACDGPGLFYQRVK